MEYKCKMNIKHDGVVYMAGETIDLEASEAKDLLTSEIIVLNEGDSKEKATEERLHDEKERLKVEKAQLKKEEKERLKATKKEEKLRLKAEKVQMKKDEKEKSDRTLNNERRTTNAEQ